MKLAAEGEEVVARFAPDEVETLIAAIVEREIAKKYNLDLAVNEAVKKCIGARAEKLTTALVGELIGKRFDEAVAKWLDAREGWIATILRRPATRERPPWGTPKKKPGSVSVAVSGCRGSCMCGSVCIRDGGHSAEGGCYCGVHPECGVTP